MDTFAEVAAALQIVSLALASAQRLYEAAAAKGDPVPEEVIKQMEDSKSANDRLHAILTN